MNAQRQEDSIPLANNTGSTQYDGIEGQEFQELSSKKQSITQSPTITKPLVSLFVFAIICYGVVVNYKYQKTDDIELLKALKKEIPSIPKIQKEKQKDSEFDLTTTEKLTKDNTQQQKNSNTNQPNVEIPKINECYKKDLLGSKVFFISMDFASLDKDQNQKFSSDNKNCNFTIMSELSFNYFVEIWNQRQQQARFNQKFIDLNALSQVEKRLLFIWLKLYFNGGIYIHPSLGVNFGKYINDRYLINAHVGKELLFAQVEYKNQKGIFVPQKYFKTVKVDSPFSEFVKKIIEKIIEKQNWIDLCQNYQCIIIKDAILSPNEL